MPIAPNESVSDAANNSAYIQSTPAMVYVWTLVPDVQIDLRQAEARPGSLRPGLSQAVLGVSTATQPRGGQSVPIILRPIGPNQKSPARGAGLRGRAQEPPGEARAHPGQVIACL